MSIQTKNTNEQELLMTFFRHHLWSNLHMFDACLALTDEQLNHSDQGTYGTIRNTLIHMVRAEEFYLHLLSGQAQQTPDSDAQTPLADLRQRAQQNGELLLQIIETVQPDSLVEVGEDEEVELIPNKVFLLQAIHHAHEHRTQIATLMGQQEIDPPAISGWSFFDDVIAPHQKTGNSS